MNIELKILSESIDPQTMIFHLQGWLDAQSEERLILASQEAKQQGVERLILDLEEISMLTSVGIRGIQKIQKAFAPNESSTNVRLCNAPPNVYHVLKMTGILQILPIYESRQAALDSYS